MKKIIIIGAGIVGLAIARELINSGNKNIIILEKENDIACHQSSRNSGVMHSGLYYEPKSLKAKFSRDGINLMKKYCSANSIKWSECGKIVVATNSYEESLLNRLFSKGTKNGLLGLKFLSEEEISTYEPYVKAKKGILVPEESIVNFKEVAQSYLSEIKAEGANILFNSKVIDISEDKRNSKIIHLDNGEKVFADIIIASSGVYSDKVAELLGIKIDNQKILPFRGEYYLLKSDYEYLVNGLIYPVPNPKLPFLGVHFTKMINGSVEAGPNAVLALAREGYRWNNINLNELLESLGYEGLRKFLLKYPFVSLGELFRSLSKELFVMSLKKIIPQITGDMLYKGDAGIRAQLMNTKGELVQDFDIRVKDNLISILNAPSPAATSSLAIANYVVKYLDL